jgi:1,4-dihydroxy-6-naphthoate synthase
MPAIQIGLSPDPDAAFMFYALTAGKVRVPDVQILPVLDEIERLNRRARNGELEVTVISAATYALVAERYRIMDSGACMLKGSGPVLVARAVMDPKEIPDRVVAIPGSHTTAALLLRLYCGDPPLIEVSLEKIPQAVLGEQAELGLLIHEGPMTYKSMGLSRVLDLGQSWERETNLPLPLGLTVVRRDLGEETQRALSAALRQAIAYARVHVDEALEHAMRYGRGMDRESCRRFVLMSVNDYSVTLGAEGREALEKLFSLAHSKGLIPEIPPLDPL